MQKKQKTSFKETAKSVMAALCGVQSDENRQRDFSHGKFSHFVIAGVIGVSLFIVSLLLIVSLILP